MLEEMLHTIYVPFNIYILTSFATVLSDGKNILSGSGIADAAYFMTSCTSVDSKMVNSNLCHTIIRIIRLCMILGSYGWAWLAWLTRRAGNGPSTAVGGDVS